MSNEPFQAVANAARAKMYRAVQAKKHHMKVGKKLLQQHMEIANNFNSIASYYRKIAVDFGSAVVINKKFPEWVRYIECNQST